jgi:hypothetical protein
MAFDSFPATLQPIIQGNFLERTFQDSLTATLGFDAVAEAEEFDLRIGETKTKTRFGKLATPTAPLVAANNSNFDNGLTVNTSSSVEQYTMSLSEWGDTINLNTVQDKVGIASQFVRNAMNLGEQAARKRDELARDALYSVYLGGNTRVLATLGAAGTTIEVDDVRGFLFTFKNGVQTSVSGSATLGVVVGSDLYTLVNVTPDVTNVSTAPGGISGALTFSSNVSVSDGTAGVAVVSSTAPVVMRPNGRLTTNDIVAGDTVAMVDNLIEATAIMRDNGAEEIDGCFNLYADNQFIKGVFKDEDFKLLYRGTGMGTPVYQSGRVMEVGGIRFVPTNMAPQQTLNGLKIRRAIILAKGALVRGDFAGQDAADAGNGNLIRSHHNGVTMITRPPMDRFGEIIAQSWKWVGGYCVPSDTTANPTIIPTANNSAFKRGIVIEAVAS